MLAQNFMAAIELGIAEKERAALIQALAMFERGEVDYAGGPIEWLLPWSEKPQFFNMRNTIGRAECETVACICGWAMALADDIRLFEKPTPALSRLFMFNHLISDTDPVWNATPFQAALALRNYLTTGEPNWTEVIGVDT